MNHESSMIQRIEALPEARKNTILTAIWLKTLTGTCGAVYTTDIETLVRASEQVETEGAKAARREDDHKLPDLPSWAPPLPEGYVPLGFGGTFKTTEQFFTGLLSLKSGTRWDYSSLYRGDEPDGFYVAPRDSEIVRLNFPWLAEDTEKREDPYEQEQRDDEADNTPKSDRDTVLVDGIGTMLRIQAASCACERRSDHNLTLAYEKAANGPAYKEGK